MWLSLLTAIIILGFALLLRKMEESSREFKKPFMIIVAIFLIIYISATIFISYNINAYSAEVSNTPKSDGNIKIIDEDFTPVDLSTQP